VLAFTPSFDVRNNSKELEPHRLSPFFGIQEGKLVLDNGFLTAPEYLSFKSNFDRREMLFDLRLFQLVRRLKTVLEQPKVAQAGAATDAGVDLGQDVTGFLPPATKAWMDAWQITERLIVTLRDDVGAKGGRFLLVTIPVGIQVHPDPEVRSRFMRSHRLEDLWYPETRIREFAAREKVDAVALGQTYQAYAEKNQVYLHGFKNTRLGTGHLNENGHRLIGEALARHLCQSH
jgi:hypothetical protein